MGSAGERVRVRVGVGGCTLEGSPFGKQSGHSHQETQTFILSEPGIQPLFIQSGIHKDLFLYGLQAKGGFCIPKRLEDKGGGVGKKKKN